MLSMHEDPNYVRVALEAGASGYVLKDAAYEELVDAIRKVADGRVRRSPRSGQSWPCAQSAPTTTSCPSGSGRCSACWPTATPTRRSRAGFSSRPRGGIAPGAHHLVKLRLSTRADLVNYALETGLLRPEPEA